ncbi:MAG: efflux RND transporter periplasmic adaptor subunit [Acidobacteriota bacterium]
MIRNSRLYRGAIPALALVATLSCTGNSASQAPAAAATRPPVAVTVAPVVASELQESVEVVGSLAPKFSADVKSEVTGTVTAVYVTEWVPVRKGDRLAHLDTRESEAGIEALKATVAQARVGEARARREFERAQQLKQFGLITPQSFDDARSAVEAAEASVSAMSSQVKTAESHLAKSFITSPMDGVVALRGVSVGDRVENMGSGEPLFRIVDNRLMDLTVAVPSSRLALVRVGQTLEFSTDALPGRTFTGKVMFINPAIDVASRSAKVVAEVPNGNALLRGGAFVKGRIVLATRPGVLQVPREALLSWNVEQQTADVFVVRGEQADKRTIKVGSSAGEAVEVVSGLQAGDQVVTRGGFAIGQGDKVAVTKGAGA